MFSLGPGSIIDAKLDKKSNSSANWRCSLKSDWYRLWITPNALLSPACFFDNLKLKYNETDGQMSPHAEGVTTRVPYFGASIDGIKCMMPETKLTCMNTKNWYTILEQLEMYGYIVGEDLYSAPFDFRKGPNDFMVDEFPRLKNLIEQAYINAGGHKVKLASLSLGGQVTHIFLTQFVDQEWKDKYIKGWMTMSGTFNGFAQAFQNVFFGRHQFLGYAFNQVDIRDTYRSWYTSIWLIPKVLSTRKRDNRVILETPSKNYTLAEIPDIMYGEEQKKM